MKVVKPLPISIISRILEYKGKTIFVFSGLICIAMGDPHVYPESELWRFWASRAEAKWPLEDGMPRTRSEYLLSGIAFPPDQAGACAVQAVIGSLEKKLLVYGDRYWDSGIPSKPRAFASMPLTWARAYGGPDFAENPMGRGTEPSGKDGVRLHWLPNVEDPRHPLTSPGERVHPVGFGPIDPMWPQRLRYQGTYDEEWLKTDFPAVAADTNWRAFNRAPEDQQQAASFSGTEEYAFHNLHPALPLLQGRLPGLTMRAFATQRTEAGEKFREIKTRLNALWFFPDAERAILTFQGIHDVAEDDGADVVHLMAALEYMDRPRPAEHYMDVRDRRRDRENRAVEMLREGDLMPADLAVPLFDFSPRESRGFVRSRKRAETERARARAEVAGLGLDPDVHAPPIENDPPPEIRSIDDLIRVRAQTAEHMQAITEQAEQNKVRNLAEVRALMEREGKDFSLIEREIAGLETRGPPTPFVDDLLRNFQGFIAESQDSETARATVAELEDMVADEQLQRQWREGERKQLMGYRMTAHYQMPVDAVTGPAARSIRQKIMARLASDRDLRGWDLTGADLSGLDFSGANLQGALMERANLTGATLTGADLTDVVLAHASLVSVRAQRTTCVRTNLGAARLENVDFEGADLTDAIFSRAHLTDVSWREATLDNVQLLEATLHSIDCSGAHAEQMLTFIKLDMRGFSFADARLQKAVFLECDVSGVDFGGAVFEKCAFVALKAERTCFSGLRVASGCFVRECHLDGADFGAAVLPNLSFRGASLAGGVLRGAQLSGCDFSNCNLAGADLSHVDARGARFVRANLTGANLQGVNLMDAVLQHAILGDTDLRHANLFQSDWARVRAAPGVRSDGALTTRMRTLPRWRPAPAEGTAT